MQPAETTGHSRWQYFPWALAGGMALVIAVNIAMATLAARSYPGDVGGDGFTLSNRYDEVIRATRRQHSLGWHVTAVLAGDGVRVQARGANDAALANARVELFARRPLGEAAAIALGLRRDDAGGFVSTTKLPEPGQWDLTVRVEAGGQSETITQRVFRP